MNQSGKSGTFRMLIFVFALTGALAFCPATAANENSVPANDGNVETPLPGPAGLGVSGASAGITTEYFEQAVTDALEAGNIFSEVDTSEGTETVMSMLRVKGVFSSSAEVNETTPYFLNVRVIKVDTPSFSMRMKVGMDAVWTLYRVADKVELMNEKIHSTYTGGIFEGGVHGANRVRVAMEGAAVENARIGAELIGAMDFSAEPAPVLSAQEFELSDNGQD